MMGVFGWSSALLLARLLNSFMTSSAFLGGALMTSALRYRTEPRKPGFNIEVSATAVPNLSAVQPRTRTSCTDAKQQRRHLGRHVDLESHHHAVPLTLVPLARLR